MRKTLMTIATASALAIALSACGDDGGSDSGSDDESTSTDEPVALEAPLNNEGVVDISGDTTVDIDAVDNAFGPTFVKVSSGAEVTVTIENAGEAVHTFTIDDQDVDVEVQPGDTAEATLTLPDAEALRFYCTFHVSQGMQGAFYSADGQTVLGLSDTTPDTTSGGSPGGYGY
jgi:plastocyanin